MPDETTTSVAGSPPTPDEQITEALDILRQLRSQATSHYDTLNNWLIIDSLTDAMTLIQKARGEL